VGARTYNIYKRRAKSMSKKPRKKPVKKNIPPPKSMKSISRTLIVLVGAVVILGAIGAVWLRSRDRAQRSVASNVPISAQKADYEVVNSYPHDPRAFLQGLVWHNGFFESTGQLGRSSLRRVEYLTGNVLQQVDLDAKYFGEGLAWWTNGSYSCPGSRTADSSMTATPLS
jgi:glutamine cyclotransferase